MGFSQDRKLQNAFHPKGTSKTWNARWSDEIGDPLSSGKRLKGQIKEFGPFYPEGNRKLLKTLYEGK